MQWAGLKLVCEKESHERKCEMIWIDLYFMCEIELFEYTNELLLEQSE